MDRCISAGVQRRPHRRSCILGEPHRCVAGWLWMDMPLLSNEQERGRRHSGRVTASDRAGDCSSSQGQASFSAEGRRCRKLSRRCKAPVWFQIAPEIEREGQEPEEEIHPTLNPERAYSTRSAMYSAVLARRAT